MIKALFFDIDGTLVSFKTHEIPASTISALKQAKANGIRLYISTGRPDAVITNIDTIENIIDGYITTNGAYCYVGNEEVCTHPIPEDDVSMMIRKSDEMNFACVVVGIKDIAIYRRNQLFDDVFEGLLKVRNTDKAKPLDIVLQQPILQFSPFITEEQEKEIMPLIPNCISGRWHPAFSDVTSVNADKGKGLISIAEHEGLKIEETMAFGDGGNDISIIKRAGKGVAMGNSIPALKEVADYVTTSVDEDGIINALKYYGII